MRIQYRYGILFTIEEKIEGIPFIKLEDFLKIEDLPPKAFVKTVQALYSFQGQLLIK